MVKWGPSTPISAFVELHIEQGPYLEAEGLDIGIVEAITAPAMIRIELTGKGGHGGGMPMSQRSGSGAIYIGRANYDLAYCKQPLAIQDPSARISLERDCLP